VVDLPYAVLLLVIVLAMPGGIAALLDYRNRRPLARQPRHRSTSCHARRHRAREHGRPDSQSARHRAEFGNVRAIDGLDLDVKARQIHGLIARMAAARPRP